MEVPVKVQYNECKDYKIYYYDEGVMLELKPDIYYGDTELILPIPQKDNHTFGGWYLDDCFTGERILVIEKNRIFENKEIILYAKWSVNDDKTSYVTDIFSDVYSDWYTAYVQYVYDNNLMTGIKGTTRFEPNSNITKAQVAQVLYNKEGQPEVTDQDVFIKLKDVYASEWYANAVAWAYNTGVVTGDLNTKKFNPNANVTREQLALMMYRYAKCKGYDVTASGDLTGLQNAENTAAWALDGVRWAVGSGLIGGIEKNGVKDLAPQGNATRAQMAAILQRFCENIN